MDTTATIDRAAFLPALLAYARAFRAWKTLDTPRLVHRLKRALLLLTIMQQGEGPSPDYARIRSKLHRHIGPNAMHAFEAQLRGYQRWRRQREEQEEEAGPQRGKKAARLS